MVYVTWKDATAYAEWAGKALPVDEAFQLLRSYCRANNMKLTATARGLVAAQRPCRHSGTDTVERPHP